jgi:glucose-1-phosphate thymidylyltransferase
MLSVFRGGRYDSLELVRSGPDQNQVTNLFAGRRGSDGGPNNERVGVCVLGPGFAETDVAWEENGSFDSVIEAVIREMVQKGGTRSTARVPESWRYEPNPKWILQANRFALQSLAGRRVRADLTDTDIEGVTDIHPTAKLESSVVRGPVVIGAGTRIKDSYIGPCCSIGDDVQIEGSEVEHSVILGGASIQHLGNRLEASVIGPGARIHREFRLPRGLRLDVGHKAEVSLG